MMLWQVENLSEQRIVSINLYRDKQWIVTDLVRHIKSIIVSKKPYISLLLTIRPAYHHNPENELPESKGNTRQVSEWLYILPDTVQVISGTVTPGNHWYCTDVDKKKQKKSNKLTKKSK